MSSNERVYEKKLIKKLIIKARKRARRRENAIFLNAGIMGIFGWHIVVPVILGACLGHFLDKLLATNGICFLILLILGFMTGGYNAYRWTKKHMVLNKKEDEVILESEKKAKETGE